MFGEGDLDVFCFMCVVLVIGYDGWLSFEIFNDQFCLGLLCLVVLDGYCSLIGLQDYVWWVEFVLFVDLFEFFVFVFVDQVEFIEFVILEDEVLGLNVLLIVIGFMVIGKYVLKLVM